MRVRYAVVVVAIGLSAALGSSRAHAGAVLGVDVANYMVLYEGGNPSSQLSINNFGTTGIWHGDIGIAGQGKLAATGPGTVDGSIDFAAANTGQASISNTTVNGPFNCATPTSVGTGAACFGIGNVQTIMNNLNTLSLTLGGRAALGAGVVISANGNNQTIQTSAGSNQTINGVNYDLFNVTSVNTNNGWNLVLQGDGSRSVVFDIDFSSQFHGNILLEDLSGKFFGDAGYAGLSPDQVLFNLYGGASLTGGDTLDTNNNGNNAHPANIIYGDFLDPNGPMSLVNTNFRGRYFGGDSTNMQIVSGDTLKLTQNCCAQVPEPDSLVLFFSPLAALSLALGRRRRAPAD